MVYRAKITRIFSTIENIYNLRKYNVVSDSKDSYIEVRTEEEAEIIEKMNKLKTEFDKLHIVLLEKTNRND